MTSSAQKVAFRLVRSLSFGLRVSGRAVAVLHLPESFLDV